MLHLKGHYQLADFQAAQRLHAYRGRLSSWVENISIGLLALLTLAALLSAALGRLPWLPALLMAAGVGGYAAFRFWLLPRQIARVFTQQKDLSAPFDIWLTPESFQLQNEFGSSRTPWENFVKWKENAELLLIYRSDVAFHMLPRRLLQDSGAGDFVREQLRAHHVSPAGNVRGWLRTALVFGLVAAAIFTYLAQWPLR